MDEYGKTLSVVIKSEKARDEKEDVKQLNKFQEFFEGINSSLDRKLRKSAKESGEVFGESVYNAVKQAGEFLVDSFKEAWDELNNMVDYSLMSNANTRTLAFTYGLNSSQAYGFTKAQDIMGIRSEEDMYYMDDQQRQKFQEVMTKYAEKYSELYDSGMWEEMLDFRYEWGEFKQDFQMELIGLIMDHKDLIISVMEGSLGFMSTVMDLLGWLVDFFGGGSDIPTESDLSRAASDILNYDYHTNTTNIRMDNTYNNVSKADQSWLANVGEMTYEQIKQALKVTY